VILPLFQDQSFDTFRSDLSNKLRYNFNFVNLDSIIPKSTQTQFIITQFACNHQTIRDNHEISCQHTDICHINIYSSRTNIANILDTSSLMVSNALATLSLKRSRDQSRVTSIASMRLSTVLGPQSELSPVLTNVNDYHNTPIGHAP